MTDRNAPAVPAPPSALPATPAPASVTPSEVAESLRRANLSGLNPGQQADFRLGLQAIAVLAARLPRDVPLALPLAFDFRPDLHAPPPGSVATSARPASHGPAGGTARPAARSKHRSTPRPAAKAKSRPAKKQKARRR